MHFLYHSTKQYFAYRASIYMGQTISSERYRTCDITEKGCTCTQSWYRLYELFDTVTLRGATRYWNYMKYKSQGDIGTLTWTSLSNTDPCPVHRICSYLALAIQWSLYICRDMPSLDANTVILVRKFEGKTDHILLRSLLKPRVIHGKIEKIKSTDGKR